jgi:histidinol-phosphate aminotransferase
MNKPGVRYKPWVDSVERIRGDLSSRHDTLRLDKNERISPFPLEFWKKVISKIRQEHVLAYPEVESLYVKLAKSLGLQRENLMITAGSDFAIKVAFELFVNPDDQVIMIDPTFAMVEVYCDLYKAEKIKIGYDFDLNLMFDDMIGSICEDVSLIMIANPNSPTGTYINNDELVTILKRAARFSIPVFVDEAYHGFCPHTALDLLDQYENLIISRTFSKAAGLAGLRIGFIVANKELTSLLYKFRPMYEVNSIAVMFMEEILDNKEVVEEYIEETRLGKEYLLGELQKRSFRTIDTYTNFIHADFGRSKNAILECFKKGKILVRGVLKVKGYDNFTRISVGARPEMERVIHCIDEAMIRKGTA